MNSDMNEKLNRPSDQTDQTDRTDPTDQSNPTDQPCSADRSVPQQHQKLRPSGGYRNLITFQITTIIYDATVSFCDRFVDHRSRLVDQLVQAARSGRQNNAGGGCASATSNLEVLLLDYQGYLQQHHLRLWDMNAPEARTEQTVVANALICLICQATYLLYHQILALELRLSVMQGHLVVVK